MALTSVFLAAVRLQGSIPSTFRDADILNVGDGEIQTTFVPLLERLKSNFFVRNQIARQAVKLALEFGESYPPAAGIDITPDTRGRVQLPPRAIGAGLRSVQLNVGNSWVSLPQRSLEDADSLSTGDAAAYYLDGGSMVLLPTGTTGTLRIRYACRPGKMVLDTDNTKAMKIQYVIEGDANFPYALAQLTGLALWDLTHTDVIACGPAHQCKVIDALFVDNPSDPGIAQYNFQSSYIHETINNSQPQDVMANAAAPANAASLGDLPDYACAADCTPFVPLPEELYQSLVHRTAGVILRAYGYDEEASMQLQVAAESIQNATPMLMPRNEGNPERIRGGLRRAIKQRNAWRFG